MITADPKSSLFSGEEFVGRAEELARLSECLKQAQAGVPWVVVVEGPAGVGKSALVRQLTAAMEDFTICRAAGDAAETDLSYGVIEQLISRVEPAMLNGSVLASLGPNVAPLSAGAALVDLMGRVQSAGPVAMIVDDVQWADPVSLQALRFMMRRLSADQVLIVLSARAEGAGAEEATDWEHVLTGLERVMRFWLRNLTAADVQALAGQAGVPDVSAAAAHRLWKHTQGHPLYVRTLLAEVSAEQLRREEGRLPVPHSLAGVIHHQVAGLPEPARLLAEALAILDARSPLGMAGELAGLDDPAAALDPLLESRLVNWWPNEPSTPVQIAHPLQRQAIYTAMSPIRRRELHAAAVPLVDQVTAWAHRVAATDHTDAALAAELGQAAAALMVAGGDVGRAATWLLWASDLSESREDHERQLLTAAADMLGTEGFVGRVIRLQPAIEACSPSPLRSSVLGNLARARGRLPLAETYLTDVLESTVGEPGMESVAVAAALGLGKIYVWQGRGRDALRMAEKALAVGDLDARSTTWGKILSLTGEELETGPRKALRRLDEVLGLPANPVQATPTEAELVVMRGAYRLMAGEPVAAERDLTPVLPLIPLTAPGGTKMFAHTWLACANYLSGKWDEAIGHVETALALSLAEEQLWTHLPVRTVACCLAAGRGHGEQASEHLRVIRGWVKTSGGPQDSLFPAIAAATLAQADGDQAGMLAALQPLETLPTRSGHPLIFRLWWRPLQVEALIGTGRLDAAEEALAELVEVAGETPSLRLAVGWLTGWLAESRGDLDAACMGYEQALAAPETLEDPLQHRAFLAHAHGRALLATHERKAAAKVLREAYVIYKRLGAQPFTDRCATDLAALGLRPATTTSDHMLELTEREREIALLVAQGLTNTEVARQLYVSVKTVEYHISHVYAKLGVTQRIRLGKFLRQA